MKNINPQENKRVDVRNEIMGIRGEIAAMGGNDSEISEIDTILLRLGKGECSQSEALRQAREIRDRKSSDH